MRYLVTGGAGFIGSHLSEYLLAQGDEVAVVDNLETGSIENIKHLRANPAFSLHVGDVRDAAISEVVQGCDFIFHLAAAVGVRLIVERPVQTIETNVRGTEVILQLATERRKPILITSTSEVYGKSNALPFKEDDDLLIGPPSKARWSYACSKALDEFLALAYWREHGVPVVIVRLFNTVGPRQTGRYGMVLPNFVQQALANEPITVFGDGAQSRCFAFVGDVVDVLHRLACLPAAVGHIFNIGSDEVVTIEDLAAKVRTTAESSSEIVYIPYDEAYLDGFEDMRRRVPCLEKIRAWTGYQPRTSLQQIVRNVVDYERSRLVPVRD